MFNFKNLLTILFLSAIFTGFVTARQPPPSPSKISSLSNNTQTKQSFVSLEGGFTIDLPSQVNGFSPIKPLENVNKGGRQLTWSTPQGSFLIAYVDRIITPEQRKEVLQISADGLIRDMENRDAQLLSKTEITSNDNPGIEIKMLAENKQIGLTRYILVNDRLFILTTGWKMAEDGTTQLRILDSFKLVDRNSAIAQKIEQATPQPLPQSPVVKKLKSDAESANLKGKIKYISDESEFFTDEKSVNRQKTSEVYYDENGNLIKTVLYDYQGLPDSITVYGYLDKMRVSKTGYVENENTFRGQPATLKPQKLRDTRYGTRYEYKYDEKRRLTEKITYWNNGDIGSRNTFVYNRNLMEESRFDSDGKLTFKGTAKLDDKGNAIEETFTRFQNNSTENKYIYKYESFDKEGNWTKKVALELVTENGKKIYKQSLITYRTITYYP